MQPWVLAGDVGGSKTSLAIFHALEPRQPLRQKTYGSAAFASFEAILEDFLAQSTERPAAACLGVAGPVRGNRCQVTNLPWTLDGGELARRFGFAQVEIVNDLVALGFGLPLLADTEVATLRRGSADPTGNALLVAIGTGLGAAFLVRQGSGWLPLPSEGGHMDLAARDEIEWRIVAYLAQRFGGRTSTERVVSGSGLRHLYEALRYLRMAPESPEVRAAIEASDTSVQGAAIHRAALAGDPLACATFDRFVSWLGATVGNLALAGLASGGIYLGGGIAPRIVDELGRPAFFESLCGKGRLREFLEPIPVRVILAPEAGLWGAAALAGRS